MKYLGPLSSVYSGTRLFYADLQNQLDSNETISTISLSSSNSNLILSSAQILSADLTTKDGHVLPANKSISFRAGCSVSQNALAPISIDYTTSQSNEDTTTVYLKIVDTII